MGSLTPVIGVFWCLTVLVNSLPVPHYKLELDPEDKTLIFNYLDRNSDGLLLQPDRDLMFDHHPEAAPDKDKLLQLTNSLPDGNTLNKEKFNQFLDDKAVTFAVFECSFVKSTSLKKQCYEDQIITYVHLVLPNDVIKEFYQLFKASDGIRIDHVKKLFVDNDETQQEENAHTFLRELGGEGEVVMEHDFDQYVRQEDLHDDFRACYGPDHQYDYECLRDKLLEYITHAFTEMNIGLIFQIIDSDGDGIIEPGDITKWCTGKCDPDVFLKMMNSDQDDSTVDFGEFRTFIKQHTVKIRIERSCKGTFVTQVAKLNCYSKSLFDIVSEHHKPIWLNPSASDMLFLFEDLDVDNNGQIQVLEDLQQKGYTQEVAEKFRDEMDGDDADPTVSLQEFNEYVGEPSVVYALSECKARTRGADRTTCYNDQLKLYITNILDKKLIETFFLSYKPNENGEITTDGLENILQKNGKIENFLKELGMGDNSVNRGEFRWYVRQKEISEMFQGNSCGPNTSCLQSVLLTYIETKMTERDIQRLFGGIDADGEWEIEVNELKASSYGHDKTDDDVNTLLVKMDFNKDGSVNFEEFRLFILLQGGKQHMEKHCTALSKPQAMEQDCYMREIWNL